MTGFLKQLYSWQKKQLAQYFIQFKKGKQVISVKVILESCFTLIYHCTKPSRKGRRVVGRGDCSKTNKILSK